MKIRTVFYSALANLGDYSNERIGMLAVLDEGESPEDAINQLRDRVVPLCGTKLGELRDQQYSLTNKLHDLTRKLKQAQAQWEATAEFLRAQGLKPDAPDMPEFVKALAPAISSETASIVQGEFDEGSYDDEGFYTDPVEL